MTRSVDSSYVHYPKVTYAPAQNPSWGAYEYPVALVYPDQQFLSPIATNPPNPMIFSQENPDRFRPGSYLPQVPHQTWSGKLTLPSNLTSYQEQGRGYLIDQVYNSYPMDYADPRLQKWQPYYKMDPWA